MGPIPLMCVLVGWRELAGVWIEVDVLKGEVEERGIRELGVVVRRGRVYSEERAEDWVAGRRNVRDLCCVSMGCAAGVEVVFV